MSRALDVPIVDLCYPIIVPTPEARRVPAVQLSRRLCAFDVIVNVPKLKTHCFVGMRGAVKNMFGCIPGKLKTAQALLHRSPIEFSKMRLDVHAAVRPALTIVDAVIGQEGPGPGSGFPRRFGLLIAGADAEAVDAVCAKILGFSEREAPTVWLARKRGSEAADLANVEVLKERLRDVLVEDLKKPRASATTHLPAFVMDAGKRLLCARPVLRPEHCLGCGDCVRICSPHAISMKERVPQFDDGECIRCLCCHEICPHGAIDLKSGFLARMLGAQCS